MRALVDISRTFALNNRRIEALSKECDQHPTVEFFVNSKVANMTEHKSEREKFDNNSQIDS